ncbi:MAG TPA: arginine deiminase family protein [Verrucomicrobiae bacterium]|nr:arginine deiminase family protein [Verrucomicrobiae bacterium]
MTLTAQSDVGRLRRVVVKHVRDAFVDEAAIDRQWRDLNYYGRPDLPRAVGEYDSFVELMSRFGIAVDFLPVDTKVGMDSLYPRDTTITTDRGVILCNMGKPQRRTEPEAIAAFLRLRQTKILGTITGTGSIEGGDVTWLDPRTLAVGRGYRTNDEGIRQLKQLLGPEVDVITVPLPHWKGPGDVFHLMSMISPLDPDLAVVYSPLLPVPFREMLLARGMRLVEVPEEEFEGMGCNILALAPRTCAMRTGLPKTRQRLIEAGIEVHEFAGEEICGRGAGGPTCMTRPLEWEL